MKSIDQRLAEELAVKEAQINAAVELLDQGSTVPFIARYRKEVTGGLDDGQLRTLEERLGYLRELEQRREAILKSIDEQDKLTPELANQINAAETKTRLEDLYLPYKPKRRTKAQIAREAGLEPLAMSLLENPELDPVVEAEKFIDSDREIKDTKAALEGARHILMERFAEDAELLGRLRRYLKSFGVIEARVIEGKENEGAKFRDYFEHSEALKSIPSHRALAIFRGRKESVLSVSVTSGESDTPNAVHPCQLMVAEHWNIEDRGRAADGWLQEVVRWTWRIKLLTHLELDLLNEVRELAEQEAIKVFASNLKDLLLAAPAGHKVTIGLDPGLRTGVKVAVVDETGKVLDHGAIFPNKPQCRIQESEAKLLELCRKYQVSLIAIGNGTASRETDKFVGDMLKDNPELRIQKVMVNESGASIYSASELAAKEFPDLDVTIRGAISIARRLQDPLAELVKIEPKSIGVGQYQHDVSQIQLARSLDAVIEDCVNAVGVDVNTASAPLLSRVSGLNQSLAANIVSFRESGGKFDSREALKQVPRFGDKSFEQAAGFLRIAAGVNPLDCSAVHPESYSVVEKMAAANDRDVSAIIGDTAFLKSLKAEEYTDEQFGKATVMDIIKELDKPGRDPRPEFKMAQFRDNVETLKDLEQGMILEGVITNVTNFGAFVDIGVHQDGLVHISALANRFVKDPRDVVKAGDIVKVKVMEVDIARKRIGLSMRLEDSVEAGDSRNPAGSNRRSGKSTRSKPNAGNRNSAQPKTGTMAELFAKAGIKK